MTRTGLESFDTWQLVALAAALGWASGIRLYAVLFIVGGLGYLGWITLPGSLDVLAHPYVLAASGFMFGVEFFADKIPGVDSRVGRRADVRPHSGGAALAASVFGDASRRALAAAILGGTLAAGSHFAKAGSRWRSTRRPSRSRTGRRRSARTSPSALLWLAWTSARRAVVLGAGAADDLAHPKLCG